MRRPRFTGFTGSSFAAMAREERRIALDHFRAGNLAKGAEHFDNAIVFARCDAAEKAEQALTNL